MSRWYRQASDTISMTSGENLYLLAEPAPHRFVPMELSSNAREIWEECGSPRTLTEIVEALSQRYGLDESEVRRDVEAFVERLVSYGLLVDEGADPHPG